jgi:hypothetical protein
LARNMNVIELHMNRGTCHFVVLTQCSPAEDDAQVYELSSSREAEGSHGESMLPLAKSEVTG